jgi:hypothetical protein
VIVVIAGSGGDGSCEFLAGGFDHAFHAVTAAFDDDGVRPVQEAV